MIGKAVAEMYTVVFKFNQSAGEMVKSGTQVMGGGSADDKCPFFERSVKH